MFGTVLPKRIATPPTTLRNELELMKYYLALVVQANKIEDTGVDSKWNDVVTAPNITGSRSTQTVTVLARILTALDTHGLIQDNTTA
jgi:hypothetical protein